MFEKVESYENQRGSVSKDEKLHFSEKRIKNKVP